MTTCAPSRFDKRGASMIVVGRIASWCGRIE
jgi:hypothetical protein